MPRYYEIESAFFAAVRVAANGKRTVTTADFVQELAKVNWHWSLEKANKWIEMSVSTFRDISTEEGDNRTFMLFNPNGGL
ncbi:DNA polymerase V [Escherichia coli]|uniref:DNA polymerase V n=1 Tax=Escherichia coli TaxID=562 RepID=UPI001C7E1D32|nr:DNA polymerase V [Escherichia coli]EKS5465596.1 DNA polymerase V [Escherichia coli]